MSKHNKTDSRTEYSSWYMNGDSGDLRVKVIHAEWKSLRKSYPFLWNCISLKQINKLSKI